MGWVSVGIGAGVGGLLNYSKNQQDARNQKAQMIANAAQIQYSPWTGASVQVKGPTADNSLNSALSGIAQGGLTGAAFGQQFKGAPAAQPAAAAAAPMAQTSSASPLGGQSYADQLGAQAQNFAQDDFWSRMNQPKQTFVAGR